MWISSDRNSDIGGDGVRAARFEIILRDGTVQLIDGAEAYEQEGPMTTFFCSDTGHRRLDSWATRLASFRSADVSIIRRRDLLSAADVGAHDRAYGDLVAVEA